jgi:hypothetical protein
MGMDTSVVQTKQTQLRVGGVQLRRLLWVCALVCGAISAMVMLTTRHRQNPNVQLRRILRAASSNPKDLCLMPDSRAYVGVCPNGDLYLTIRGIRLHDLNAFKGWQVVSLDLTGSSIEDIRAIQTMPALDSLTIADTPVSDLSVLSTCRSLVRVNISNSSVTNLVPLRFLPRLDTIVMNNVRVRDLSPLRNVPVEYLEMSRVEPLSMAPLRGKRMRYLVVSRHALSDVEDAADVLAEIQRTSPNLDFRWR